VQLQEKQKYANKLEPFNGRKAKLQLLLKVVMKWKRFYFLPEICSEAEARQLSSYADLIEINKEVYQKLAYRDTTEGVLLAKTKSIQLSDLNYQKIR
jgi:TrmH family RNA methyltransferase